MRSGHDGPLLTTPLFLATSETIQSALGKGGTVMTMKDETDFLQQRLVADDSSGALGALLEKYQTRLERIVQYRIEPRLRGRIDPSDVVQEACLEALGRLDDFRRDASDVTFFLWLRFLVVQKLAQLTRFHAGAEARTVFREAASLGGRHPATSLDIARQLLGASQTSPSHAAARNEQLAEMERAIENLNETDQEILGLRHSEQLTNSEAARVLKMSETATSNRYVRALLHLRQEMGGGDDATPAP